MIPQVFPQMGLGYATRWSYFLQDVWDWHEILFSNRTCFYESGVALLESVVMIWVCLCLSENRIGMKPKSNGWSWGLYLIFRYTHFIISMVMTQEPRKIGCTDSIYFWHMFQAYASGNIPTIHMARNMVLTYLHKLDPEMTISSFHRHLRGRFCQFRQLEDVPKCPHCGGPRVFECQVDLVPRVFQI
jgi:hypothetical protein